MSVQSRNSEIQSVLFDSRVFDTIKARQWLKKHKMNPIKRVDKMGNQLRYRMINPAKFKRFITLKNLGTKFVRKQSEGIMFVIGFP